MFWLTLIYLGARLLLLLFAPDWTPFAVGQCVDGRCNLPGRAVSYAPYSVGNVGQWQAVSNPQQFANAQIVGQPVLVQTRCGPNGCPVPACGHTMCTNGNCAGDCTNCAGCVHASNDWRQVPGQPGQWAKYENGKQVAGWDEKAGIYRTLSAAGQWGEPVYASWARRPEATPEKATPEATPAAPTGRATPSIQQGPELPDFMRRGVDMDKLPNREQFLVNGREVDPKVIEGGASNDPSVPDFTKHCQIVVTGKDAAAANAMATALKSNPVASKCWVVCASPDSWRMEGHQLSKDAEFQRTGQAVFLQGQPDKEGFSPVLDKVYEFSTADAVAQRFERKINPNYDPNKSPSGGGDKPLGMSKTAWTMIGGLAIAFVLMLTPARKEEPQWSA